MTTLMKKAIEELSNLPEEKQDFYAQEILDSLEGDEKWDAIFDATTDEQWEKMTEEVKRDIESGNTLSSDEFFTRTARS